MEPIGTSEDVKSSVSGPDLANRVCKACPTVFSPKSSKHIYCSKSCGYIGRRPPPKPRAQRIRTHECITCGTHFESKASHAAFCSEDCRKRRNSAHRRGYRGEISVKPNTQLSVRSPLLKHTSTRGRYVYAWLDDGAVFYIGKGVGDRVIQRHQTSKGLDASCQSWRDSIGERFSFRIIRDNLTDEGSALIESVLIDLINPACNIATGMQRKERPPLTLPRHLGQVA